MPREKSRWGLDWGLQTGSIGRRVVLCVVVGLVSGAACGEQGLFPTTVDPGPDFAIADVVFDEDFFYCEVEPMLFASRCGPGDSGQGDAQGGCHYNVTSYRLTEYSPLVADSCSGLVVDGVIPPAARQNYQTSQARMRRDPEQAPLLTRPTGVAVHPRVIFDASSSEADLLRQWATQYSSQ